MREPTIPLPPIGKTPTMRLIEAHDPEGRDVREVVKDLYDEIQTLDGVAAELSRMTGETITRPGIFTWIKGWGWKVERMLTIPADATEGAVAA